LVLLFHLDQVSRSFGESVYICSVIGASFSNMVEQQWAVLGNEPGKKKEQVESYTKMFRKP